MFLVEFSYEISLRSVAGGQLAILFPYDVTSLEPFYLLSVL